MIRPALMAAALAAAFPACAGTDLDALRAELQQMKSAYEARIQALEARLDATETNASNATPNVAPAAPHGESVQTAGNQFNPEISLILQGGYARLKNLPERRIAGFLPGATSARNTRGFSADESELVLSANIDPNFRGYFNAVLDEGEIGVEEAWFQTLRLDHGLTLKGGRIRSGIGYQNEQHPHAWDFATNNLMYEALVGEAYTNDGLQLKWVAPTDLFTELGAEIGRGSNFPGTDRNKNGAGSYALFGHLGGDIGDSHSWRGGVSYLSTHAVERSGSLADFADVGVQTTFSGDSRTWLADFVWKWAPRGNPGIKHFKFAAELFRRRENGQLSCDDLDPAILSACTGGISDGYRATQYGGYAQGVYQFMPHWRAGYRYDLLDPGTQNIGINAAALPQPDYKPRRHSLMIDYSPSEFSRVRLQYTQDRASQRQNENQWYLQYIFTLGAHGAHAF